MFNKLCIGLIYKWERGGLKIELKCLILFLPPCTNTCTLCLENYCQQIHNIKWKSRRTQVGKSLKPARVHRKTWNIQISAPYFEKQGWARNKCPAKFCPRGIHRCFKRTVLVKVGNDAHFWVLARNHVLYIYIYIYPVRCAHYPPPCLGFRISESSRFEVFISWRTSLLKVCEF